MKPRIVAFSILGIVSLIGIINSILGNIVATLIEEKLGTNAEIVIIPFVVLAALLIGYELRDKLFQHIEQDTSKLSPRLRLNRARMIDKVEAIWIKGFLDTSLYKVTRIELELEKDSTFVEFPWEGIVQRANLPNQSINSSKDVYKVFKELGEELLILGSPGSGKTTLLLELTKDLLKEARKNESLPIPIVFNLSTWSVNRKTLNFWIIDELASKYDVPRTLAKEWIDGNDIIPLLDGLDEVRFDYREQCVKAINEYRQNAGFVPIIVCSRRTDYELLAEKLRIQAVVVIKPLSKKQVSNYFRHESLRKLGNTVREDLQLSELLDTPLMLNIVTLAFGKEVTEIPKSAENLEQRRNLIFEAYIDAMFKRRIKTTKYKKESTINHLSWLAHIMQSNSQSVFHLDNLQPEMLRNSLQQRFFMVLDKVVWPLLLGSTVGLVGSYIGYSIEKNNLLVYFDTPTFDNVFGFVPEYAFITSMFTIMCGVLFGGINFTGLTLIERVKNASIGMLIAGFLGGISPLIRYSKYDWITPIHNISFFYGFTGLLVALVASITSGGPSLKARHIYPVERLRWSLSDILYNSVYTILIITGLSTIFYSVVGYPLLIGGLTNSPLIDSLLTGLVLSVFVGLISGLKYDSIEVKSFPNQGITRSWIIALLAFFTAIITSALIGSVVGSLIAGNPANIFAHTRFYFVSPSYDEVKRIGGQLAGFVIGISEIIPIAIAIALSFGGYTFFSHYSIRLILWFTGATPLKYVEFLDYCVDRIFLRRVGGGYTFVHRLLLETFAQKYTPMQGDN